MDVLLDTNVVLDVLLNREPWVEAAKLIWRAADQGRIKGYLTACTLTNIDYIARRVKDQATAKIAIRLCLQTFGICSVDRQTLAAALELAGRDFEDNVQIACAFQMGIEVIVTRDSTGFQNVSIPVLTPDKFVETYLS